jgi:hypothetical protein
MNIGILIPILALSIPLVAVVGRVIIEPIVKALTQLAQTERAGVAISAHDERRASQLEARLDGLEEVVQRLVDDYEFRKALESPAPPPQVTSASAAPPPGPRSQPGPRPV